MESAPVNFWRLAFPLPYRADLERFSKQNNLDPFLMAALIRQESEFDAKVISPANARGLTQIEPTTGRELSRKLKVAKYTTAKLFQPELNLQFGTYYLRLSDRSARRSYRSRARSVQRRYVAREILADLGRFQRAC